MSLITARLKPREKVLASSSPSRCKVSLPFYKAVIPGEEVPASFSLYRPTVIILFFYGLSSSYGRQVVLSIHTKSSARGVRKSAVERRKKKERGLLLPFQVLSLDPFCKEITPTEDVLDSGFPLRCPGVVLFSTRCIRFVWASSVSHHSYIKVCCRCSKKCCGKKKKKQRAPSLPPLPQDLSPEKRCWLPPPLQDVKSRYLPTKRSSPEKRFRLPFPLVGQQS